MKLTHLFFLSASAALLAPAGYAQTEAATDPVGAIKIDFPANADSTLSLPLTQPAVFEGPIESVNAGASTITLDNGDSWTVDEFIDAPHYALIMTGTDEGMFLSILANTADTLTVELGAGDTLANLVSGDTLAVIPYWTPPAVFGDNAPAGVQLLLFDGATPGINVSASDTIFYNGSNWISLTDFSVVDEMILYPGESYIVRNQSASPFSVVLAGGVPMAAHRSVIATLLANEPQDTRIAYLSPVDTPIGESGLGFNAGDQILVFDEDAAGLNKSSTQTAFYNGSQWIDLTTFQDVSDTLILSPGRGYIYRRAPSMTPDDAVWQEAQTYFKQQ